MAPSATAEPRFRTRPLSRDRGGDARSAALAQSMVAHQQAISVHHHAMLEEIAEFARSEAFRPTTQLHLTRWVDPAIEAKGYPDHLAGIWIPILGPSAMVLLVRLQGLLDVDPGGCSIDLNGLSQSLGLGTCDSKHAPLPRVPRAISRLVHFGLAKRMAPGQLAVRCQVGPPSPQQLSGLSLPLQIAYRDLVSLERAGAPGLPASEPSPTTGQTAD